MSPGAPRFSSFRCSGEQSRKDKGPGCCPKPPQSATPYVHTPLAAITLFGEEPIQRYPIQLEWVVNQQYLTNEHQTLLFVLDTLDHLSSLVDQLNRWMRDGKLNYVMSGAPELSDQEIKAFSTSAFYLTKNKPGDLTL